MMPRFGKMIVTPMGKMPKPDKEPMTSDALIAAVKKEGEGMPFRLLNTPRKISMKARHIRILQGIAGNIHVCRNRMADANQKEVWRPGRSITPGGPAGISLSGW
jgi:hypothetical protein